MGDRIYCNRENRRILKELGIQLEGNWGARRRRTGWRMTRATVIRSRVSSSKARLKDTWESWVAMILVVMDLVRLAGKAPYFWLISIVNIVAGIFNPISREIKNNRETEILFSGYRLKLIQ
jgi:hypothetical protein